jgi:hypothetical protein
MRAGPILSPLVATAPPMTNLRLLVVILGFAILVACTTPAEVRPIGTVQGNTRYRVSCEEQSVCDATIARTCPTGHFEDSFHREKLMFFDFYCTSGRQSYSEGPKSQSVQVAIPPECKNMLYGPDFLAGARDRPRPDSVPWDPARAKAFVYKDPRSAISLSVDNDGRSLVATDSSGRILWVRNPFEDARLCPYRTPRPIIYEIDFVDSLPDFGERMAPYLQKLGMLPTHKYVQIRFDSSQFGLVDETSGNFLFEGQN